MIEVDEKDEIDVDVDDEIDTDEIEDARLAPVAPELQAERLTPDDDRPSIGSWWWLQETDKRDAYKQADYDEPEKRWIACVVEVGSNYVKLEGVKFHIRVALDGFHERCQPESDPGSYIDRKVGFHKQQVRELTGEIQKICAQLGVPFRQALAAAEADNAQALAVVHGTADIKAHKKALVKAKDKTLPELFEKIKAEHAEMAKWMKAELIPMEAELEANREVTSMISDKIHTVELYAGLQEQLAQVKKGAPASNDSKVYLMQRRHYMDEECLARYEAGGMSFDDIKAFDKWLGRDENFTRILPHERCIVAFRVRRYNKRHEDNDLSGFIKVLFDTENDKATFLYIRNGRQLWRMHTSVEFDAELFPCREDNELLGDEELWVNASRLKHDWPGEPGIITGRKRAAKIQAWKERRSFAAQQLWQWHRAGKPKGNWQITAIDSLHDKWNAKPGETYNMDGRPYGTWHHDNLDHDPTHGYDLLTPENIYYDDAIKKIRRAAFEHNRIAVIVQGLLDRSTCLHPHPPWRIWTPEGFEQAIELVYDVSRVIESANKPPKWEDYRAQLNMSIREGAYTIGQYKAWHHEFIGAYDRRRWEIHEKYGYGPARIARVVKVRGGKAQFKWQRNRRRAKWIDHPTKRGYLQKDYDSKIDVSWYCPLEELTCINAYTPGDYHMFYDDPITRADYIKWAPILLAAEDWHAKRRNAELDDDGEED